MFVSAEADELRAFIRDKLGLAHTDAGDGWLIFELPQAEIGCHPVDSEEKTEGTHQISFYCDDIDTSVAELKARGVEFTEQVSDAGWGLTTRFKMPGGFEVMLYEPRYRRN